MSNAILFVEKYFGLFLIAGLIMGLTTTFDTSFILPALKLLLMITLFLVFLKLDMLHVLQKMKNYRQVIFLTLGYMVVIPLVFFFAVNSFNQELAVGVLLLTAMPAASAAPVLTDIVKGNAALSTSIVISTSMIAPFTVPLLFWILLNQNLPISPLLIFGDIAPIIFIPMVLSQVFKKYFPELIGKSIHLFTPLNILLLTFLVYALINSQRNAILNDPVKILWEVGFLFVVFILLHIIGFFMGYNEGLKEKIATSIGAAYMNNSMAIVLAAIYFKPSILVLMILSEVPWNTLLMPFGKIMNLMTNRER